jgi:hypothetical protein
MAETKTIALVFAEAGDTKRTLKWPCKVSVPQDGGKVQVQEIDATFSIPTTGELQAYQASASVFGRTGDVGLLEKHLKGFPELKDEKGADVPFEKAKATLFQRPYIVDALVIGLIEMARGRAAKN